MYHALGYGTLMYLQAALTFDMVSCIAITLLDIILVMILDNSHNQQQNLGQLTFRILLNKAI